MLDSSVLRWQLLKTKVSKHLLLFQTAYLQTYNFHLRLLCWQFFPNFFNLFSLKQIEFEPIISEWVEEVLNCKVNTPHTDCYHCWNSVEEVINCKVNTPSKYHDGYTLWVEEVLNCKVITTVDNSWENDLSVKQVLNCKVKIPLNLAITPINFVEEVLNSK